MQSPKRRDQDPLYQQAFSPVAGPCREAAYFFLLELLFVPLLLRLAVVLALELELFFEPAELDLVGMALSLPEMHNR